MASVLFTSTPAHGHVTPLMTMAEHLRERGHRVTVLTSERYRTRIEAAGIGFLPLPSSADLDLDDPGRDFPERAALSGVKALQFDMRNLFIQPGEAQYHALRDAIDQVDADIVLTECLFIGAAIYLAKNEPGRVPVVTLGIFPLTCADSDVAPFGLGVPPRPGVIGRVRNALLRTVSNRIFTPAKKQADTLFRSLTGRPWDGSLFDWPARADVLAQFTVPGFEYPRRSLPSSVRFIGPLPVVSASSALPDWWSDLDGSRPVIHVTQGTIANKDVSSLISPAIQALADEPVLTVVATGGRPVPAITRVLPQPLPENVRIAEYLPYPELLPRTRVIITNGGYGGVQAALRNGVPLVIAGTTEDKTEVSARVAWSGVGVNLKSDRPSPAEIADAVRRVLTEPSFAARARALADEMQRSDSLGALESIVTELTAPEPTRA